MPQSWSTGSGGGGGWSQKTTNRNITVKKSNNGPSAAEIARTAAAAKAKADKIAKDKADYQKAQAAKAAAAQAKVVAAAKAKRDAQAKIAAAEKAQAAKVATAKKQAAQKAAADKAYADSQKAQKLEKERQAQYVIDMKATETKAKADKVAQDQAKAVKAAAAKRDFQAKVTAAQNAKKVKDQAATDQAAKAKTAAAQKKQQATQQQDTNMASYMGVGSSASSGAGNGKWTQASPTNSPNPTPNNNNNNSPSVVDQSAAIQAAIQKANYAANQTALNRANYSNPQENNTYANAPTQATPTNTGAFYPTVTPDNIATKYGNMFGGGLSGLAGKALGTDNPLGQALAAYNNFNPADKFLNQAYYGMNEASMQEYQRLEATDPNWASMSEKDRVNAARAPYMAANNLNSTAPSRPSNISQENWDNMTQGQKTFMTRDGSVSSNLAGNGSGGSNAGNTQAAPTAEEIAAAEAYAGRGASVTGNNGQYFDGGYTGTPVEQLSQARSPRGMQFGNIYGTTQFDPLTGQMIETQAPEYQQFQQGLLGQLQGSQDAYQSFDPQDAASEYLRGVNAIREPLREQQTQSSLSRLIQSGKLGSTAGTQALAQLESEQENQRFQEGVQATQYGSDMQDRMLRNQAGMFGLTQQVADQQFKPQQAALGSVPMLQEIYGFAQEPQFQESLAQQGIAAQSSANDTSNWMGLGTAIAGSDAGQNAISDIWNWLT